MFKKLDDYFSQESFKKELKLPYEYEYKPLIRHSYDESKLEYVRIPFFGIESEKQKSESRSVFDRPANIKIDMRHNNNPVKVSTVTELNEYFKIGSVAQFKISVRYIWISGFSRSIEKRYYGVKLYCEQIETLNRQQIVQLLMSSVIPF